jgi:hypothetical protein
MQKRCLEQSHYWAALFVAAEGIATNDRDSFLWGLTTYEMGIYLRFALLRIDHHLVGLSKQKRHVCRQVNSMLLNRSGGWPLPKLSRFVL